MHEEKERGGQGVCAVQGACDLIVRCMVGVGVFPWCVVMNSKQANNKMPQLTTTTINMKQTVYYRTRPPL